MMAQFVDDLAGLLVRHRVVLRALQIGEREQDAAGEVGIERQRHQRRQQRVPAEQRHEPRSASRDQRPLGMLLVDDAQRSEVGERPVDRRPEARIVGDHRRCPLPPSGHAVDRDRLGRRIERRVGVLAAGASRRRCSMLIVADPRGVRSRCQLQRSGRRDRRTVAAGSSAHGSPRRRRRGRRARTSQPVVVGVDPPERPGRRPPLTSNTWAKSAPIATSRSIAAGCDDVWRTSISSRMPTGDPAAADHQARRRSPALRVDDALHDHRRQRVGRRAGRAFPALARAPAARKRDRCRRSSTTTPWVCPPRSPERWLMTNVRAVDQGERIRTTDRSGRHQLRCRTPCHPAA